MQLIGHDTKEKQSLQIRMLNDLSNRVQSLLGSEQLPQEIINCIQAKFNYYGIHFFMVNENGTATLQAQAGAYLEHLKVGHVIRAQEGIVGEVIRTKKSYWSSDVRKDKHFTDLSLPVSTQSELAVPVLSSNQVVAVINVESDRLTPFDEEDVLTLETVASQIAVVMANQRLYCEAKNFSLRLQQAVDEKTVELRLAQERILDQQALLQKENKALKTWVQNEQRTAEIIGKSPLIISLVQMVDKIAPTLATVLIQGESGTGKELIAKRLHMKSARSDKPYVTVNCGALQESLLESEIFGHEKGSFTGAFAQKIGLAETADGGTLFLDEIGEMSLSIQAKFLRFLQEGEFYRVGGKRPIRVSVRVVSATNRDLQDEVKTGRFREDLFYRLNTILLRMPALRKRKEDIELLVQYFLKNTRFGGVGQQVDLVEPSVMTALKQYDWPGNIRELQNTIERLKILADHNEIKLDDLPMNIRSSGVSSQVTENTAEMSLEELEKSHILKTLTQNSGNKTRAAQSLGITIKTLYNKLHRYGIIECKYP